MNPAGISFDNSFAALHGDFYHRQSPEAVPAPALIRVNRELAAELGIDSQWLASDEGVALLSGNATIDGAAPLAAVYAGHQFGSYNPQLGDGRAILLGEVIDRNGHRRDIQLKGSGRTPYSRGGDGKSPLGPVLREYIVSEAMHGLGVPTTRALAAVSTGESVYRDRPLPGAILTRVASSHLRIGSLQYFAARGDLPRLRELLDYAIDRHYPDVREDANPALAFFQAVLQRQAALIAQWQCLGFIHGVMNTDNMLLCGETIDYGPCAFMDEYHPGTVFSSIDSQGRYAYGNQPRIAQWNLVQLAQCLLPLIDEDQSAAVEAAQNAINTFPDSYMARYREAIAAKFGLSTLGEQDSDFIKAFFQALQDQRGDFTLALRRLYELQAGENAVAELFDFGDGFSDWLAEWRRRLAADEMDSAVRLTTMRRANPVFIPRNHLVEQAIDAAQRDGDFSPFHDLLQVLSDPFDYRAERRRYATGPESGERVLQTFCGT